MLKWALLLLCIKAELDDSQQEVMDMFDLVEEVGQNFYEYIDINPGLSFFLKFSTLNHFKRSKIVLRVIF